MDKLEREEIKALEKLILKTLSDKTYNLETKEHLFYVMEIICNMACREDIHIDDLKYYL